MNAVGTGGREKAVRRFVGIVLVVMALVFSTAAVANRNDSTVGESGKQRSTVHSPALTGLDLGLMAGAVMVLVGVGVGLRRAARASSSDENAEFAEPVDPRLI